ncbi:hypothetical protein TSAR_011986 [Trichomalopsis sarcophagae]|uniref:Reverse transcriptase domain-containing protein n=1 Tax=Trichomalopsis sarcophagae TaxID=543379 RepID=A0A232EZK9_9HYME|nr:hypothetical protein TSAR_011986 [Trichomalopsis sarcophagae]
MKINSITIDQNNANLLERCDCNLDNLTKVDNNYIIETPTDIVNSIGAFFETINAPRFINQDTLLKVIVDTKVNTLTRSFIHNIENNLTITNFSGTNPASNPQFIEDSILFHNTTQIMNIFHSLPNKFSAGLDNIPPIVLKHLPTIIISAYTIIFNNCLNNRFYPEAWKKAKILPILQKGKPPNEVTSYRPISLTPSISKVYEVLINNTLNHYTNLNSIIPDNQFGFKHKHSTTHALHKLLNDINSHLHNKEMVCACFVDLERAFDSVWINGLINKLHQLKYPLDLIQLIWHMTRDRKFQTWDGENLSTITFDIIEGLMQGTVNSPALFNIFTHNIPNLFNLNSDNITHSLAIADDLIILTANTNLKVAQHDLEILVNKINNVYAQWNLRINLSKCETIVFHKPLRFLPITKRNAIKNFSINIINKNNDKQIIENKKKVKYLGLQFDYLLRLNDHSINQLQKAKNSFRANSRIFFNKNLSPRTKIICYLLLIRPIITYAAPILWNMSASLMEKLRKFERMCIRTALHAFRKDDDSKHFINS